MKLSPARIASPGLWLAGACLHWGAMAAGGSAPVWRCGNTYTDVSCPAGRSLAVDDARSPTQQREAERMTRNARTEGQRMERDRLRLESTQGPAILIDNAPKSRPDTAHSTMLRKPGARKDVLYVNPNDPPPARRKKRKPTSSAGL